MRWIIHSLLGLFLGYAAGAGTGLLLMAVLSGNQHDRLQEMTMTAAFLTGPVGAVLGVAAAFAWMLLRKPGAVRE